jgi:hypothetical protein
MAGIHISEEESMGYIKFPQWYNDSEDNDCEVQICLLGCTAV